MANTHFNALLAPGRIAGLDLSNRVFLPAMDMNLCVEGEISDGEIAHYTARSRRYSNGHHWYRSGCLANGSNESASTRIL